MPRRTSPQGLTRRQVQVLALLTDGFSNREIASLLGVTEACVKYHVAGLFRHFGVDNRLSVAVRATAEGRGGSGPTTSPPQGTASQH